MSTTLNNKTKSRTFKILKKEAYAYKNTCCIKSINVKKPKNIKTCLLYINQIPVPPSTSNKNEWIWDFEILREKMRDFLGDSQQEQSYMNLERTFVYNQLKAIQYYTLTTQEYMNSVFTSELMVQFAPYGDIDELEASEIVYLSDEQSKKNN